MRNNWHLVKHPTPLQVLRGIERQIRTLTTQYGTTFYCDSAAHHQIRRVLGLKGKIKLL